MRAYVELFIATIFWGFGFIAAIWSLEGMGPVSMVSLRFLLPTIIFVTFLRYDYRFSDFIKVFRTGFFLFALMILQTWGLKYTSATKSGFITVLYVLFIPILEFFVLKKVFKKILLLWITLALIGTAMICGAITSSGISKEFINSFTHSFNQGDFLTLLCSIAAAAYVISISLDLNQDESKSKKQISPTLYHIYQCAWTAIFAGILAIFTEGFSVFTALGTGKWNAHVWIGILSLGILSSGIAFLLQLRAQRTLSSSTVGLVALLESPWAMFFSVLLLKENLNAFQIVGACLIMLSTIAECLTQMNTNTSKT